MSEQEYKDPSGNTEQFRAFVRSGEPEAGGGRPVGLIAAVAIAAVAVIAVVVWLAVS